MYATNRLATCPVLAKAYDFIIASSAVNMNVVTCQAPLSREGDRLARQHSETKSLLSSALYIVLHVCTHRFVVLDLRGNVAAV